VLGPAPNQTLAAGGRAGLFASITSANGDTLESVSAADTASSVTLTGGAVSVPAAADGTVNLTGPDPRVILTGLKAPLTSGRSVTVVFHFATAGDITLQLPVEPHAYDYATFAPPPSPTPSTTPSPSTSGTARKAAKKSRVNASPSGSTSPSATPSPTP
jgi:hypothetical protein